MMDATLCAGGGAAKQKPLCPCALCAGSCKNVAQKSKYRCKRCAASQCPRGKEAAEEVSLGSKEGGCVWLVPHRPMLKQAWREEHRCRCKKCGGCQGVWNDSKAGHRQCSQCKQGVCIPKIPQVSLHAFP
jgi:hypothetical protein